MRERFRDGEICSTCHRVVKLKTLYLEGPTPCPRCGADALEPLRVVTLAEEDAEVLDSV